MIYSPCEHVKAFEVESFVLRTRYLFHPRHSRDSMLDLFTSVDVLFDSTGLIAEHVPSVLGQPLSFQPRPRPRGEPEPVTDHPGSAHVKDRIEQGGEHDRAVLAGAR